MSDNEEALKRGYKKVSEYYTYRCTLKRKLRKNDIKFISNDCTDMLEFLNWDGRLRNMTDKERVIAKLTEDYSKLDAEELLKIGFRCWDKQSGILLVPMELYDKIPDGTELTSIGGEKKIKGKGTIDTDTRGGLMAWGLVRK